MELTCIWLGKEVGPGLDGINHLAILSTLPFLSIFQLFKSRSPRQARKCEPVQAAAVGDGEVEEVVDASAADRARDAVDRTSSRERWV